MSYRAFKRLLGETSLERKCRFLLGAFILLLISASFWLFAHQTEELAYAQINNTCQLLVVPLVAQENLTDQSQQALKDFRKQWQEGLPDAFKDFKYRFIIPHSDSQESIHEDSYELDLLEKFQADPNLRSDDRRVLIEGKYYYRYYASIRAGHEGLIGHAAPAGANAEPRKDGDLVAMLSISIPTEAIERGMHINRALLISAALITALLTMSGSYLIVRYVIVKPV
jgi:two-component system, NarL family, sensor histidine kinase BarA